MVIYCGQVDLTLEAAHLQRFIYNFRKWKNVSFPVPIYPFVHPTVLVEVIFSLYCHSALSPLHKESRGPHSKVDVM
jgi:hypothetical protein